MADKKQSKFEKVYITGTLVYPNLNRPDTKGKYAKGDYNTGVRAERAAVQATLDKLTEQAEAYLVEMRAELNEKLKEAKGKAIKSTKDALEALTVYVPFAADVDDGGNELSTVVIRLKLPAIKKNQDGTTEARKPTIVNASGKVLARAPEIWGGTLATISGFIMPVYAAASGACGVGLRMRGAQILKLVTKGDNSNDFAKQEGYEDIEDVEEDAYEAPAKTETAAPNATEEPGDTDF